jgi:two-component system, LuxR family, sensor kinase FixL
MGKADGLKDPTASLRERSAEHAFAARRVLDAVADGVLILADDGTIVDINVAAEKLFAVELTGVEGRHVSELLQSIAEIGSLERLLEQSVACGGIDAEIGSRRDGGFPVHITVSQSLESEGNRYVLVVRDFRAIRSAQQRILETERLAAIGETMAALAHESRNALQRMQSCLTLLKLRTGPEVHDLVDDMQDAQDQLQRLYEEVRSFAAPLQLSLELVDLPQLLDKTWRQLRMQWAPKRLVWAVTPEWRQMRTKVSADAARLGQVLRNVLENAIQASPDGGRVAVRASEITVGRRPMLRLSIDDEGPGVPAKNRTRIFDLLYTTKPEGTGMGLAIARRIVREHDGEILVEDSELGGARVVILLPPAKASMGGVS